MTQTGNEPPDQAPAAGPVRSLLSQGAYLRLLSGSLTSTLSDRLYQAALLAAVQMAFVQASTQLALLTAAWVVGQFVTYPFIGPFLDHADRRRLLWRVCALRAALVLVFVPFLMQAAAPTFAESWKAMLGLLLVLSLITAPFPPARGAAIPDVVGAEQTGLAASLIACVNLVSLLAGSLLGAYLSVHLGAWCGYPEADRMGPALVIPISSALFVLAALLLAWLPDSVAVPGVRRLAAAAQAPETQAGPPGRLAAYLRDLRDGFSYALGRRGVLTLFVFEAGFWFSAVCFYLLFEWHTPWRLHLTGSDKVLHMGLTLSSAGAGLLCGAFLVGRVCRIVSPIFTYPLAFLLLSGAMAAVFGAGGRANPGADAEVHAANLALARGLLPYDFVLGLGGGFLLGRVDADMLGLLDARQRGRMFALKGFFFAGALLALLWLFATRDGFELCWRMSRFLPRALMWAALGSLALGWILDCGLYAQRKGTERPGPLERTMYLFGYLASYLVAKLYFRLSVVGRGKIPRQGPVILAANHGSFLDPFLLGLAPRRLVRYIMHAAYYRSVLHPMFRYLCTIPVEAGSTLAALRAGREVLENGGVVGMFPEGHVSDDGKLQKPKSGALLLAQRSGATVVPVAIRGNVRALPRWRRFPRPHKITLVIGEPFKVPPDAGREELSALSDKLMAELAGLLGMEPPAKSGDDRE